MNLLIRALKKKKSQQAHNFWQSVNCNTVRMYSNHEIERRSFNFTLLSRWILRKKKKRGAFGVPIT